MNSGIQIDQNTAILLTESEAVGFLKGKQFLIMKNDLTQTDKDVIAKVRKCIDAIKFDAQGNVAE